MYKHVKYSHAGYCRENFSVAGKIYMTTLIIILVIQRLQSISLGNKYVPNSMEGTLYLHELGIGMYGTKINV